MRCVRLMWLCVLAALPLAGCGQSVSNQTPTPTNTEPTPTPTPQRPDTGNGQDGDIQADSDITVNTCHVLTSASEDTATVDSAAELDVGRRVLLLQMQDDFGTSGLPTNITDAGLAGQWEIVRIADVTGTTLTLESTLKNTYTTAGTQTAQLCTVPEYETVTVNLAGRFIAPAWDGSTGGIIAFYSSDVVTIIGSITTSGRGFRGGPLTGSNDCNSETAFDVAAGRGGGKGEGMDGRAHALSGRGVLGTGGGGGNCHNAGGGGGGSAGAGGTGGREAPGMGDNPDTKGLGGGNLDVSATQRLTLGAGGGAGQHNDAQTGTPGEAGGGIIFIVANDITGNGVIEADGVGASASGGDGAGGGGAGGTIWIQAVTSSFNGRVSAIGGDGGDVGDANVHGPGGGGGGGRIGLSSEVQPNETRVAGGASGLNQNNDPHGATAGDVGVIEELPEIPLVDVE